jgi:hypothetical protein
VVTMPNVDRFKFVLTFCIGRRNSHEFFDNAT